MPVRLTLRSNERFSPFREMLHWLIETPIGDSLLLCSGYIWEPSEEYAYRILDDQLLDSLRRAQLSEGIITVAGKFDTRPNPKPDWRAFYRNFVSRIKSSGLSITPYVSKRDNWHAKIAMRLYEGLPVAAIVGSSNLTGPAYRMDWRNWNFEGDVLIWGSPSLDSHFKRTFTNTSRFGDIFLVFDPKVQQPNEDEQMLALFKDVMHSGLKEFVE